MMISFSTDDLRTPESLERVLRQFATESNKAETQPPQPDLNKLVNQLLPLVQKALQAGGTNPLNLQSLLGAVTAPASLTPHAIVIGDASLNSIKSGPLGTIHQTLHGNPSGDPTFSTVDLAAGEVTGILGIGNGGTNAVTAAAARTSLGAAAAGTPGAHTITLAKITAGGTNGSLTWNADGVITAFVDPT
jgi:hypothetical protein